MLHIYLHHYLTSTMTVAVGYSLSSYIILQYATLLYISNSIINREIQLLEDVLHLGIDILNISNYYNIINVDGQCYKENTIKNPKMKYVCNCILILF